MSTNRISQVDANLTLLLAQCAFEAYSTTQPAAPDGYQYYGLWQGRNPSALGGDVETYGYIFQGNTPSTSSEYIFAFKGTASFMDAYEDVFVNMVPFTPYNALKVLDNVEVADGFQSVYTTEVSSSVPSMQTQLFDLIEKLNPTKLLITGHSLGSALAELFALDLYVSMASLAFKLEQYNFACPRVGNQNFADLYRTSEASSAQISPTIRIVNYWDIIPCVPFEMMGYVHGPDYFLCSFYKYEAELPHYTIRHSMGNYWMVLNQVVKNNPQAYAGVVTGYENVKLQSTILSASETECSSQFGDEWMNLANKMGAKKLNKGCLSFFGLFG